VYSCNTEGRTTGARKLDVCRKWVLVRMPSDLPAQRSGQEEVN
jgi:hypothetical protein